MPAPPLHQNALNLQIFCSILTTILPCSSSNSIYSEKDNDSLEEPLEFKTRGCEEVRKGEDERDWGCEDLPPPPLAWSSASPRVVALYPFQGEAECNLGMEAGEQLVVVEEDAEGWSKVRRVEGQEEGYVPTSFLQVL